MKFPILPTVRAAWLAALAAPVAVVIGATAPQAWLVVPAAAAALLVLVLLDGVLAGRLADWRLAAPADCEVGEPLRVGLVAEFAGRAASSAPEAAFAADPRLAPHGRIDLRLAWDGGTASWQGHAEPVPTRRGTGAISHLWLRWAGPLGLGARQVDHPLEHEVRVWPDLSPVRSPELQRFLRDAQFGLIARRIRGEGTQFEALSEYEPGMDRRRIDWKSSARQTRLYARENESERNNQIVFAFDCGQAMCEPVEGLPRIDRAVSAALTAAYVALKGGDRVALYGFAQRPELFTPFIGEARAFHRLQAAAAWARLSRGRAQLHSRNGLAHGEAPAPLAGDPVHRLHRSGRGRDHDRERRAAGREASRAVRHHRGYRARRAGDRDPAHAR